MMQLSPLPLSRQNTSQGELNLTRKSLYIQVMKILIWNQRRVKSLKKLRLLILIQILQDRPDQQQAADQDRPQAAGHGQAVRPVRSLQAAIQISLELYFDKGRLPKKKTTNLGFWLNLR